MHVKIPTIKDWLTLCILILGLKLIQKNSQGLLTHGFAHAKVKKSIFKADFTSEAFKI